MNNNFSACDKCVFGTPSDCWRPECITADGFYRGMTSVNRELPAPAIQVDFTIVYSSFVN